MWQVFIVIYLSYLILGPHWIANLISGRNVEIVDSPTKLFRRAIFISYVAILFTSWFLYKPSLSTFTAALIMAVAAATGFYIKYGMEPLPMHIFLIGFIIHTGYEYMTPELWLAISMILFYMFTHEKIYRV